MRVLPRLRCHPEVTSDQTLPNESNLWSDHPRPKYPLVRLKCARNTLCARSALETVSDQSFQDGKKLRLFPGWGPDLNWFMIRPGRAHHRVFPDRNYRVWKEVRAHYSLDDGLEMVWSEVILVWKVWTMVWRWSDQRSIWSKKSGHRRIRAQLGLIITSSSALGSD